MQAAAATASLWHRRLGHFNRKNLGLLNILDNAGVSFDGPIPDWDLRAVGNSHQLPYPKTADHKVKLSVQLVFADLIGSSRP